MGKKTGFEWNETIQKMNEEGLIGNRREPGQAHYPEEWGPSNDRRLTCVCGNPDPAHADHAAPCARCAELETRIERLTGKKFSDRMYAAMESKLAALEAEVKHWKHNHDHRVEAARILIERPDVPFERVEAYKKHVALQERNAALEAENKQLDDEAETFCTKEKKWFADLRKAKATIAQQASEIAKLIEAVADHVTVRAEQYATIQKQAERIAQLESEITVEAGRIKAAIDESRAVLVAKWTEKFVTQAEQLAAAQADAKRLDYLLLHFTHEVDNEGTLGVRYSCDFEHFSDVRGSIDAAIAASREGKK